MGAELGRISGPLLSANLLRDGIDLAFETDLLYLNVVDGRVGINTDIPNRLLQVNGTSSFIDALVDNSAQLGNLFLTNNTIQNSSGSITISPNQLLDPKIVSTKFATSQIEISDQLIANIVNNSNIILTASGTGQVIFNTSKVYIDGDLHATGNITWEGNITIGNSDTDSVTFSSDVNSNIIPDETNTYDLGSVGKVWKTLYVDQIQSDTLTASELSVNNIDMLLTQGNTIYVSMNGLDTNTGEHLHNTFRTIKHALSVSQPGDEIVIFPGDYEEAFPLTVPQGVSIKGSSIRSVTIRPTLATKNKDAFLLNGETTVSHLTIKDFLYDSLADTGYGFRFASGASITIRSPYVQNITIITSQDGLTPAGRGALVDGSAVLASSREASMLFSTVTFIVPNSEGITATNGSRVEWINCFTYYANRGIHLIQGTQGFAGQSLKFGAEMRSINSANVYGTYGAVADGANTLAYLIGHNFGYIGSGTNNLNDNSVVIQANEVVELNSGVIYYDSMDHKGDYRVGDIFYVNQDQGTVTFDAQSIDFGSAGNITFEGPSSTTVINKDYVQTGNIRVYNNNVDSLQGPVNLLAASGSTYLNTNVFVTGNLTISNDVITRGVVYIGNDPLDLATITPNLTQNINPKTTNLYSLGSDLKRWDVAYIKKFNIDDAIDISNNSITSLVTNSDLNLVAAGTGVLNITQSNVDFNQNLTVGDTLTVNNDTSLKNTQIAGSLNLTGDYLQTGNLGITGLVTISENITILGTGNYLESSKIKIQDNSISATETNSNIVFSANGTGQVRIENFLSIGDGTITNTRISPISDIERSIRFSPNGTGSVVVDSTKSLQIPVGNQSTMTFSSIGEIRYNDQSLLYEGWTPNGLASFNGVWDSDRNTYITAELTPGTNDNILRFGINGTVRATIDSTKLSTSLIHAGGIEVSSNTIRTLNNTTDLNFSPNGTGYLNVNNIKLQSNTITNVATGALTLATTGLGYVRFNGTGAIIFPYGTTGQRRLTPEVGEIRNNSTLGYMEVYSGDPNIGDNGWIPGAGISTNITEEQLGEINDLWTLILG